MNTFVFHQPIASQPSDICTIRRCIKNPTTHKIKPQNPYSHRKATKNPTNRARWQYDRTKPQRSTGNTPVKLPTLANQSHDRTKQKPIHSYHIHSKRLDHRQCDRTNQHQTQTAIEYHTYVILSRN
jgi:hypothetical protein